MSERDLEAIAFSQVALAILASLLLVSGLLPGTYGLYQWLGDHKELAPWFSGAATTLGVWVALFNGARQVNVAAEKDLKDEQRAHHQVARSERAMAEAACGSVNMARLAAKIVEKNMKRDNWRTNVVATRLALEEPLRVASAALAKFPAHQLSRSTAVKHWYRIEIGTSYLFKTLADLEATIDRSTDEMYTKEDHDEETLSDRDAVIADCQRLFTVSDAFARALGLEPNEVWDELSLTA